MFGINLFSAFFQSDDSHVLVEKARIANHLAKMANGKTRDLLYTQKILLLCRAVEMTPNNFAFTYYDERGLIGLRYAPTHEGFHLPAAQLTAGARTAIVQSLTRFLSSSKEPSRVA
jgi:hypothetical protein